MSLKIKKEKMTSDDFLKTIHSLNKVISEYYDFLERLESTTKDEDTAEKIRTFMVEQGIWKQ